MTETVCARIRLKDGSLSRVDDWAAEMNSRKPEVLATLKAEGVNLESVFLERASDGDFLIYFMRADDLDQAARVAAGSDSEVDVIHRAFKSATFESRELLRPLIDFVVE